MAVRSINTYTATVTPQLAEAWLTFNYDKQRPINKDHVAELAEAMRRELFTTNTIKFGMYGDRRCMVNGQHTLRAIIKSECVLVLPVQDFAVDGESDIQKLYYHEDINRKRNFGDSSRAVDLAKRTGLHETQIKVAASALRHAKSGFGTSTAFSDALTFDDLLELVEFWAWEVKAIYNSIAPCSRIDRNMLISRSVFSVALITMRYRPTEAREFWRQVAQDDGLDRYDARKTLRQWLLVNAVRSRRNDIIAPVIISRAVASAWNAWREQRELKVLQPIRKDAKIPPLRLDGCGAFNGTQGISFVPLSATPNEQLSAEFGIA